MGLSFDAELLVRVTGSEPGRVYPVLAEGVRVKLIESERARRYRFPPGGGRSGVSHRFVHDRIREALLSGLTAEAARHLHRKAAEALPASEAFARAEHYWLSCDGQVDATTSLVNGEAGLLALERHAHEEAYELLSRAERCRPESVESGSRGWLGEPSLSAGTGLFAGQRGFVRVDPPGRLAKRPDPADAAQPRGPARGLAGLGAGAG